MNAKQLRDVMNKHEKWVNGEEEGVRANLQESNLLKANLLGANLLKADLRGAYLQESNLQGADLRGAYLQGAYLQGADLDYCCWPLWCGSFDVKVDLRIAAQIAYHFCRLDCDAPEYISARNAVLPLANMFHRVNECGRLEPREAE